MVKQIKKIIFVLLTFCLVTSISAQGKLLKTFTADLKSASKEFSGEELFKAQEKIFADFGYDIVFDKIVKETLW